MGGERFGEEELEDEGEVGKASCSWEWVEDAGLVVGRGSGAGCLGDAGWPRVFLLLLVARPSSSTGSMNLFTTCISPSCMSIFLSSGTFLTNGNKFLRKISSGSLFSSAVFRSVLMTPSSCLSHSFSVLLGAFFLAFLSCSGVGGGAGAAGGGSGWIGRGNAGGDGKLLDAGTKLTGCRTLALVVVGAAGTDLLTIMLEEIQTQRENKHNHSTSIPITYLSTSQIANETTDYEEAKKKEVVE